MWEPSALGLPPPLIVESRHEGTVDIVGVFLVTGADEIEISDDDPRAVHLSGYIKQFKEKGVGVTVIRRTVNVGDSEYEIRQGAAECNCE